MAKKSYISDTFQPQQNKFPACSIFELPHYFWNDPYMYKWVWGASINTDLKDTSLTHWVLAIWNWGKIAEPITPLLWIHMTEERYWPMGKPPTQKSFCDFSAKIIHSQYLNVLDLWTFFQWKTFFPDSGTQKIFKKLQETQIFFPWPNHFFVPPHSVIRFAWGMTKLFSTHSI